MSKLVKAVMKAWSYSSLKHFEQCAKSYYHQRIVKSHKQGEAEYLSWGNKVHKHLEDRINLKTPLPDFLSHLEPVILGLEATGKLMIAEMEFAFTREWKPTRYWADDAWTRGKIDVMLIGQHDAIILDWKTGKRRPDFGQLEYYALAVGLLGIKKIRGHFAWIKTKEFDTCDIDERIIKHVQQLFTDKAAMLEKAYETDIWPAKTSALCAYCPVVNDCAEARAKKYHLKAKHIKKARPS